MSEGESEINGGKGRRLQRRAPRGSLQATPKRRAFTLSRRQGFLDHFAASCNAAAAARAVGISENCVAVWRRKDAQFAAGWSAALAQGYARLEAELVREAERVLKPNANRKAAPRIGAMDAKTALAVLEAYRRSGGRAPGEVWPHPYDIEAVRARLEKKLRVLGVIDEGEREGGGEEEEPPPPLRGPPPPREAGGEEEPPPPLRGPPPPPEAGEEQG